MEELILKNITDDGICFLTLNKPEKLNCIGSVMLSQLNVCLDEISSMTSVHMVVLQGAGDRAFSSGADLKEFGSLDSTQVDKWVTSGHNIFSKIEHYLKPTVAVIDGYALGGGLELALACDFRISLPTAIFSFPELSKGWLPGWGGLYRTTRLLGEARAKELVLLGKKLSAREALSIGLVNNIVLSTELNKVLNEWCAHFSKLRPEMFQMAKAAIAQRTSGSERFHERFDIMAAHFAMNQISKSTK
jgi:enoyl-CoA hydratase/carnithine racemase